jgi:hypothetical protein
MADAFLQLIDAAVDAGLKPDEVRGILWAIVAPATLDDLPEILRKLRRVLLAAENTWQSILTAAGIASWPDRLATLQPIARKPGYPTTPLDKRHLGKRGDAGHRQRNALYSALLALPDGESAYSALCDLLMAHVFLAHLHLLRLPAGTKLHGGLTKGDTSMEASEAYSGREAWPALTIQPKNCCLAMRAYFSGEEWARAVLAVYPVNLPPADFAVYVGLTFDGAFHRYEESQKWLNNLQDYLLYYIAQAYGIKPHHRGHGKKPLPPTAEALDVFRHDICPHEDEDDGYVDDPPGSAGSGAAAQSGPGGKPRRRPVTTSGKKRKDLRRRAGTAAGVGSDPGHSREQILSLPAGSAQSCGSLRYRYRWQAPRRRDPRGNEESESVGYSIQHRPCGHPRAGAVRGSGTVVVRAGDVVDGQ